MRCPQDGQQPGVQAARSSEVAVPTGWGTHGGAEAEAATRLRGALLRCGRAGGLARLAGLPRLHGVLRHGPGFEGTLMGCQTTCCPLSLSHDMHSRQAARGARPQALHCVRLRQRMTGIASLLLAGAEDKPKDEAGLVCV